MYSVETSLQKSPESDGPLFALSDLAKVIAFIKHFLHSFHVLSSAFSYTKAKQMLLLMQFRSILHRSPELDRLIFVLSGLTKLKGFIKHLYTWILGIDMC
jgi:hypothetical protein